MNKTLVALVLGLSLLSMRESSFADEYGDCTAKCDKIQSECLSSIHFVNEVETQDATIACNQAANDCHDTCREKVENPPPPPEDGQQQPPQQ